MGDEVVVQRVDLRLHALQEPVVSPCHKHIQVLGLDLGVGLVIGHEPVQGLEELREVPACPVDLRLSEQGRHVAALEIKSLLVVGQGGGVLVLRHRMIPELGQDIG